MTREPTPNMPEPIHFPVCSLHFAGVYSPLTGPTGNPQASSYGVAVPWQDLPERLADIMFDDVQRAKASSWGLVNFRSNRKPRVYGMRGDNSDLIDFHAKIEAMNMPFESCIAGVPGELFVTFWDKTKSPQGQIGVALESIRINPSLIELPGFTDVLTFGGK
jgi:hypothetical protein